MSVTVTALTGIQVVCRSGLLTKVCARYAYFKKLTYFSTECIYAPDGSSSLIYLFVAALSIRSLSRPRSSLPQRPRSHSTERDHRYHSFRREFRA